jgi:hypothetical protein
MIIYLIKIAIGVKTGIKRKENLVILWIIDLEIPR